jgi:hypothetical protein
MYASTRLPSRPPNTIAPLPAEAVGPGEALGVLAARGPLLEARLLRADVHRRVDEHADRQHGGREAGVQHRRSLAVRVLPSGLNRWRVPVTTPRKMV